MKITTEKGLRLANHRLTVLIKKMLRFGGIKLILDSDEMKEYNRIARAIDNYQNKGGNYVRQNKNNN